MHGGTLARRIERISAFLGIASVPGGKILLQKAAEEDEGEGEGEAKPKGKAEEDWEDVSDGSAAGGIVFRGLAAITALLSITSWTS